MTNNDHMVNSGLIKSSVGARNKWVLLLLLVLVTVTACTESAPADTEADEVAVYSAVVQRIYNQDDTFGGALQAPKVHIVATTDDSVGDPDIEQSEPKSLSETVQEQIVDELADLPAQVNWVDDASAVPLDPATGEAADGGVIITLGNLHVQEDGSLLVSASIYIASLAAGGQTYIVEQVNGGWEITGTTGVAWMS